MRNLIKSILILFISLYSVNAFAATGAATEYSVTMTKLELCETGSTTANCLNPLTISPSGTSGAVDIASVNAGAVAGSYGNIAKAKIGILYTFIQITMSRQFSMTGTAGSCATKAGATGSKTADAPGQTGGTPGSSTLYVPDSNAYDYAYLAIGSNALDPHRNNAISQNEISLGLVTFGDDDNSDCYHSGFQTDIEVSIGY